MYTIDPASLLPKYIVPNCLPILNKLDHAWTYRIHEYNTASFGDSISAFRIGITIYLKSDIYKEVGDKRPLTLDKLFQYGYKHCIRQDLNIMDDLLSITLYNGSLPDCVPSPLPSIAQPLIIAAIQGEYNIPAVVLHPLYPARQPTIASQ